MSYATIPLVLERHRGDLARLLSGNLQVGQRKEIDARIDWFYSQNPTGRPTTALGIEASTGEVIGCGSYYPRMLHVPTAGSRGREIKAGALCDFSVDASHRTAGAAIAIQRALTKSTSEGGPSCLYGSPNGKAVAIFKRVGYRYLGECRSFVKPLRSRGFLERHGAPRPAAAVAASIIDGVLQCRDLLAMERIHPRIQSDVVASADSSFDNLCHRVSHSFVTGLRSSAYLNWRYGWSTGARFEFLRLKDGSSGRLVGYAVFRDKRTHAEVCDVLCEDTLDVDIVMLHLSNELRRRRHIQTLWVSYFGTDQVEPALTRIGFTKRQASRAVYAWFDPRLDEGARRHLENAQHWFMLEGELDI